VLEEAEHHWRGPIGRDPEQHVTVCGC
jgi:hypothetical protein